MGSWASAGEDLTAILHGVRGAERVIACYQCGTCSGSCPTASAMDYTPRRILHMLRLGLVNRVLESRSIWLCTSCYSCTNRCPREIRIGDAMLGLRALAVDRGVSLPANLLALRDTVIGYHNISGDDNAARLIWSDNLQMASRAFGSKRHADVVFFVGCVASFYPTVYGIPQAMIQVMARAGLDVATLGGEEWCCGYPLFTAGMPALLESLMAHNLARVQDMGAKTLVTTCPSCHYTWSHVYPQWGASSPGLEILHASEFLARLMEQNQIRLGETEQVVTYHDPCDLGRKSGIFDAPRRVIAGVPGVEFREMDANREQALCCGGGGDVQIVDEGVTASVASRRMEQVQRTGARVLLSACQQCKRTLLAAARRDKLRIRVMDLAELVWQAMEQQA
ncbi:MAG: (Fe-S)-binding protein [Chloroflexi bacterium]|nr:MAG: (Fe-S)-binding protein [Chloroflexota bacterium]